jgi:sporulation protein YlmC with PRC-barrel domain
MELVGDLQDKKVVDRNGRELGRVDRVVLEVRAGEPPCVVAIELGIGVLGSRLGVVAGGLLQGLEHALRIDAGRPYRIPLTAVLSIDDVVKVDVAAGDTPALALEQRLRAALRSMPGA